MIEMNTNLMPLEVWEDNLIADGWRLLYVRRNDPRLRGYHAYTDWISMTVYINNGLYFCEKLALLLHEYGHIAEDTTNELRAWEWAYKHYLDRDKLDIIVCDNTYENYVDIPAIADYFSITPDFITAAMQYYHIVARYRDPDFDEDVLRLVR